MHMEDFGKCDPEKQIISIRMDMNKQTTEQTFYDELVHAIMFTMGKLNHDEEFVDTFGAFLHQYHIRVVCQRVRDERGGAGPRRRIN